MKRKPAEGVFNIVRFNWPFFAVSLGVLVILLATTFLGSGWLSDAAILGLVLLMVAILVPLAVSFYVYDCSGLYHLSFLKNMTARRIMNLTAGFDEITPRIRELFPDAKVLTLDFYDHEAHSEPSIRRARKRYPADPVTIRTTTSRLQAGDGEFDLIVGFLAVHEVRNLSELEEFFAEMKRALTPGGKIIVVEHLRDFPNFMAYSLGFFHFHGRSTWQTAFDQSGLHLESEECFTPFLRIFKLTAPS